MTDQPASVAGKPAGAVFLSYASEDAAAAARLAEALNAAGIEVWFDQNELRGGDAWDQTIRQRIRDCRLFVAVISASTEARPEGYFRREWKLAVERTHDMSVRIAFLVPILIDGTAEAAADVPEEFRARQWTSLPGGVPTDAFVTRIAALLAGSSAAARMAAPPAAARDANDTTRKRGALIAAVAALLLITAAVIAWRVGVPFRGTASNEPATDRSVAVLPFADLSASHDQAYFSDGITEQLLELLAEQPELQVPGRTSTFYFKDRQVTLAEVAQSLHVAHVLTGSVRRSGNTVRVSVQLVRAATGFQAWSKSYDRDVADVLKVQDEIAAAVVAALRTHLLSDSARRPAQTIDPEAYEAFLRGRALSYTERMEDLARSVELLTEATQHAPDYAPAWAALARSRVVAWVDFNVGSLQTVRAQALHETEQALAADPGLADGHFLLGLIYLQMDFDRDGAARELDAAERLGPVNSAIARLRSRMYLSEGDIPRALAAARNGVELDPVSGQAFWVLGWVESIAGDNVASERDLRRALELVPGAAAWRTALARTLLSAGRPADALAEIEREPDRMFGEPLRPIALDALGRHAEADAALARAVREFGDTAPDLIARVYGSRGDVDATLSWVERAYRVRAGDALYYKVDPAMDPVRKDPRYVALIRKLKLPE